MVSSWRGPLLFLVRGARSYAIIGVLLSLWANNEAAVSIIILDNLWPIAQWQNRGNRFCKFYMEKYCMYSPPTGQIQPCSLRFRKKWFSPRTTFCHRNWPYQIHVQWTKACFWGFQKDNIYSSRCIEISSHQTELNDLQGATKKKQEPTGMDLSRNITPVMQSTTFTTRCPHLPMFQLQD